MSSPTIGLVAMMQDEEPYVRRWLDHIAADRQQFFDIVVIDGGSKDRTVEILRQHDIRVVEIPYLCNSGVQRNHATDECRADWVLHLDADEIAARPLLGGLFYIAKDADDHEVDCVGIPRINIIDGAVVAGPGTSGLDYQYRFHHRRVRWTGRCHELTTGWRNRIELKLEEGHFIIHDKTSARNAERNAFYVSGAYER